MRLSNRLSNQRGGVLVVVLILAAGIVVVQIGMLVSTYFSHATAVNYKQKIRSFFASDGIMTYLSQEAYDGNMGAYLSEQAVVDAVDSVYEAEDASFEGVVTVSRSDYSGSGAVALGDSIRWDGVTVSQDDTVEAVFRYQSMAEAPLRYQVLANGTVVETVDFGGTSWQERAVRVLLSSASTNTITLRRAPQGYPIIDYMSVQGLSGDSSGGEDSSSCGWGGYEGWGYRAACTLNTSSSGAAVTQSVTNFPIVIRLTSAHATLFSQADASGEDIRFSTVSGAGLAYQIESWDAASQQAVLWVKVPSIAANSDSQFIYMYWGNPTASSSADGAAVFGPSRFEAVYHLSETSGTRVDASGNNRHCSATNTSGESGVIGGGASFSGGSGGLEPAPFTLGDNAAIALWIKPLSVASTDFQTIVQGIPSVGGSSKATLHYRPGTSKRIALTEDAVDGTGTIGGDNGSAQLNSWVYVVVQDDGTGMRYYHNGQYEQLNNQVSQIPGIKALGSNQGYALQSNFTGMIDEVQVYTNAVSPAWIRLCYENQKASQTLVRIGVGQSCAAAAESTLTDYQIFQVEQAISVDSGAGGYATSQSGYTGANYFQFGNSIQWSVSSSKTDSVLIGCRYASGELGRGVVVNVNGVSTTLDLEGTGGWNSWASSSFVAAELNEGLNTIRMTPINGGVNLDRLHVQFGAISGDTTIFEAEAAQRIGGSLLSDGGSSGGAVYQFGDTLRFSVTAPAAGVYPIRLQHRLPSGTASLQMHCNDSLMCPDLPLLGTTWGVSEPVGLPLEAGSNSIALSLRMPSDTGMVVDYLHLRSGPTARGGVLEAEASTHSGVVEDSIAGFSSTGYVKSFNAMQWSLNTPVTGAYSFAFRFTNGGTVDGDYKLSIDNSIVLSSLLFPVTAGGSPWVHTPVLSIVLNKGTHVVKLQKTGSAFPCLDYLQVLPGTMSSDDTVSVAALNVEYQVARSPELDWVYSIRTNAYILDRHGKAGFQTPLLNMIKLPRRGFFAGGDLGGENVSIWKDIHNTLVNDTLWLGAVFLRDRSRDLEVWLHANYAGRWGRLYFLQADGDTVPLFYNYNNPPGLPRRMNLTALGIDDIPNGDTVFFGYDFHRRSDGQLTGQMRFTGPNRRMGDGIGWTEADRYSFDIFTPWDFNQQRPPYSPNRRRCVAMWLPDGQGGITDSVEFGFEDMDVGDEDYDDIIFRIKGVHLNFVPSQTETRGWRRDYGKLR